MESVINLSLQQLRSFVLKKEPKLSHTFFYLTFGDATPTIISSVVVFIRFISNTCNSEKQNTIPFSNYKSMQLSLAMSRFTYRCFAGFFYRAFFTVNPDWLVNIH